MIRVGPAGWSYPDWKGIVYPGTARFDGLAFLVSYFETLEINSSFYRVPTARTTASWAERASRNPRFRFTLKLFKGFTHERTAADPEEQSFRDALQPQRPAKLLEDDGSHALGPTDESSSGRRIQASVARTRNGDGGSCAVWKRFRWSCRERRQRAESRAAGQRRTAEARPTFLARNRFFAVRGAQQRHEPPARGEALRRPAPPRKSSCSAVGLGTLC